MFHPALCDLTNDEQDVSDINPPSVVVPIRPGITPESHQSHPAPDPTDTPRIMPLSEAGASVTPSDTPEKTLTVGEFCKAHGLNPDQFVRLRKRATKAYPDLDFSPIREGAKTWWVQQSAILAEMIQGSKPSDDQKSDAIDGEIVDQQELSDGSLAIVRRQTMQIDLPPIATKTRESVQIDYSPLERLADSLRADQAAKSEFEEMNELRQHAEKIAARESQKQLIELLIQQGYTPDQAVKIATGGKA